jgi:hypothetical protein
MRSILRFSVLALGLAAAPGVLLHGQGQRSTPAGQAVPAPPDGALGQLLTAATRYVEGYQNQLTGIVMEESYTQDFSSSSNSRMLGQYVPIAHRELRSDLLLIRPGNGANDVEFRDVFEVDGRPVRDRQERLTRLFLDPSASATKQIQAIIADSARYNIGSIERTINTPTLPLVFLLSGRASALKFAMSTDHRPSLAHVSESTGGEPAADLAAPDSAAVMTFQEPPHGTLIHTNRGQEVPSHGRFWIDPDTGEVLMSELVADELTVRAVVDVAYGFDDELGLLVPSEMRERYEARNGALVEGRATYSNFRQFQVKVDTSMNPVEKR